MHLLKRSVWWKVSVAARAWSAVGGDAFLLFLMPSRARAARHFFGGRGGG